VESDNFIVSQRTSSIQHADKIIVLDDGEIVGIGKHDELLETCEVYREIYDSQFKKEENDMKSRKIQMDTIRKVLRYIKNIVFFYSFPFFLLRPQ